MPSTTRIAHRTCPLCEAGCGLEITLESTPTGERVKRIRGDRDDVFSQGYLCPKGTTLGHLHEDPDWLRRPVVKRDGEFVEVDWDEAFATIAAGLLSILDEHGRDASAIYLGNPGAHSIAPLLYNRTLIKALGTRNRFSASTVDQRPKEMSAGMMFGSVTVPVPDLDRTDFVVLLGANPYASNGSLCTAPDFPGRLERIRARADASSSSTHGASETAERADQHVSIRPGTDAHLLAAVARTILADDVATPGRLAEHTNGLDDLAVALADFDPEQVAATCGVDAGIIRRLAHDLAAAPTAAVYGRIGTCTQEFGTLASWLVDVVNLLTGNLDRVGGAMFATRCGRPAVHEGPPGRRAAACASVAPRSRVARPPEALGEFPVVGVRRGDRDARRGPGARRWSPSPATRSRRTRTPSGSTPRSPRSSSWCRSTRTSTRRRVTPT